MRKLYSHWGSIHANLFRNYLRQVAAILSCCFLLHLKPIYLERELIQYGGSTDFRNQSTLLSIGGLHDGLHTFESRNLSDHSPLEN